MRPNGPSSKANGIAFSCSKQNISKGKAKVSVLPEPV